MNTAHLRFIVVGIIFTVCMNSFAQYGQYSQRSLLEKKIYYVANGKIGSASFWSLPVGKFDCTLRRYFPGEDTVQVNASINFAILSSGYVEGQGYGDRGKIGAEAQFVIQYGGTSKKLEFSDIDYVYQSGGMIKPKKGAACPLVLSCEGRNSLTIRRMQIMIWMYDNKFKELKHSKDVPNVTAFSFTKEGAYRALKAQRASVKYKRHIINAITR